MKLLEAVEYYIIEKLKNNEWVNEGPHFNESDISNYLDKASPGKYRVSRVTKVKMFTEDIRPDKEVE